MNDVGASAGGDAVIARTGGDVVVPRALDQRVGSPSTNEPVAAVVAGAREVADAAIGQVLGIGAQRVRAKCRDNGVGAFARVFADHIAGVVDVIGVVAGAADHGVGARAAVERVVAGKPNQRIGATIADQVIVRRIAGAAMRSATGK